MEIHIVVSGLNVSGYNVTMIQSIKGFSLTMINLREDVSIHRTNLKILWQVTQNSFSLLLSYFVAHYVLIIVV